MANAILQILEAAGWVVVEECLLHLDDALRPFFALCCDPIQEELLKIDRKHMPAMLAQLVS